uniref:Uncharacterized protein n=1 Tax=Acrobeloides nanus TaxID=290746 RepID=A0A914DE58_9BILA
MSLNSQGAIQRNPNGNSSSQTLGFEFPSQSSSLSMMNQTFPTVMPKSSHFLLFAYMLLDDWQYPLYQLYVILDTLITLIVLRTYRNALKKVLSCAMKTLKIRVYKTHDLSMYKKTTSINQWTRVTKSTK